MSSDSDLSRFRIFNNDEDLRGAVIYLDHHQLHENFEDDTIVDELIQYLKIHLQPFSQYQDTYAWEYFYVLLNSKFIPIVNNKNYRQSNTSTLIEANCPYWDVVDETLTATLGPISSTITDTPFQ
jgi:hypothetical protein